VIPCLGIVLLTPVCDGFRDSLLCMICSDLGGR